MSNYGNSGPGPAEGDPGRPGGRGPDRPGTVSARSSRRHWGRWAAIAAGFVVVGVGAGLIGASAASSSSSSDASGGDPSSGGCNITSVADRVLPSVVTIQATGPGGGSTGSGEIIHSDGEILTNNHVIATAASGGSVQVLFSNGATAPATIVGRDPMTDLAVLKVSSDDGLKAVQIGSSDSVQVGQPVIVLGAPLGLSGTVTSGIVSALNRTVQEPGEGDASALLISAVQTDAAINPGNSGGAMVNCSGQLIGVPSAGASAPSASGEASSGNIGLNFAIPVDIAKTISNEIIQTGRVTHGSFGMQTQPIEPQAAQQAGVPQGLFVASVTAGGPAAQAGLQPGDIITKINGDAAVSNVQVQELTLTKQPGDTVPVDYWRSGKTTAVKVTLGSQP
jgi:putative serine protease PepD